MQDEFSYLSYSPRFSSCAFASASRPVETGLFALASAASLNVVPGKPRLHPEKRMKAPWDTNSIFLMPLRGRFHLE